MNTTTSRKLFAEAKKHMPGGVNSPVRSFGAVGAEPLFIEKANGGYVWDADGNRYIDYIGSWGPMIVGHAHHRVIDAIVRAASNGTSFGACSSKEIELAALIKKFVPSVEMVRLVNSGTEATMSALRLARAFTQKDKVIKFEGCYHGHCDSFLIKAGSGIATLGHPDSPGVTSSTADDTLVARYNDIDSVYRLAEANDDKIAAIFIEPVAGNMGCVPAEPEFLKALRELCSQENILLIFDEVMTGFRLARGGAQEIYDVKPDLSTFGKIIGGGLPVGAYGGRADIMSMIAPSGPVYQAGTFSGNPLAMAAGVETLKIIDEDDNFYININEKARYLADAIRKAVRKADLNFAVNHVGSMLTLFFTDNLVSDMDSAKRSDDRKFASFFRNMLEAGVYLPPSQFEAWFVSAAHSTDDLDRTIGAAAEALREL